MRRRCRGCSSKTPPGAYIFVFKTPEFFIINQQLNPRFRPLSRVIAWLRKKYRNDWVVLIKPLLFLVQFVLAGTYHFHATGFAPPPLAQYARKETP